MSRRRGNASMPLESTRRPGRGDTEAWREGRNGRHGRIRRRSVCGRGTGRMGSRRTQGKSLPSLRSSWSRPIPVSGGIVLTGVKASKRRGGRKNNSRGSRKGTNRRNGTRGRRRRGHRSRHRQVRNKTLRVWHCRPPGRWRHHRRRRLQIIRSRPGIAPVIRGCVCTHVEVRRDILVRTQSPFSFGWIPRGFRGSAAREDVGETSCPKVHRIVDTPARRVTDPVSGKSGEQ